VGGGLGGEGEGWVRGSSGPTGGGGGGGGGGRGTESHTSDR